MMSRLENSAEFSGFYEDYEKEMSNLIAVFALYIVTLVVDSVRPTHRLKFVITDPRSTVLQFRTHFLEPQGYHQWPQTMFQIWLIPLFHYLFLLT